jgi:hypothetical protein
MLSIINFAALAIEIKAIQVHHFAPRSHEVVYEFRLAILARVNFCQRS